MNFRSGSKGVGLIEVLVTLLVLSVGLLGLAALQSRSLQFNNAAYQRSQANVAAYDIADRMRINRERALAGDYNIGMTASAPAGSTLSASDLSEWRAHVARVLPDGTGAVSCAAGGVCTVTMQWSEQARNEAKADTAADAQVMQFTYMTRL